MANTSSFENAIRIDRDTRTIELSKNFDKAASRFGTREYEALQQVRKDYPNFTIVVKTVRNKADHYKGLTYDFMKKYIESHDDEQKSIMAEYMDLRGKSDEALLFGVDSLSYAEIKAWFFKKYPEIEAFQRRREQALAA